MKIKLAILTVLLLSSCAGLTVRQKVALPVMERLWVGIYADVRRGIDAQERTSVAIKELRLLADDMSDALKQKDIPRVIRVDWARLRNLADLGITKHQLDGQIGPGVADSYHERVVRFSSLFLLLEQR